MLKMMAHQKRSCVCGKVHGSTTPMQVTAIRFVHPVAHTDAVYDGALARQV